LRLGRFDVGVPIAVEEMLPAASQGAIGIEVRSDRQDIRDLLNAINDRDTFDCVMAERHLLAGLNAGCHSPVAAYATVREEGLLLRAEILSEDGSERVALGVGVKRRDVLGCTLMAHQLLAAASMELRALFGA
jgi:hydroxymethylbilane synthase